MQNVVNLTPSLVQKKNSKFYHCFIKKADCNQQGQLFLLGAESESLDVCGVYKGFWLLYCLLDNRYLRPRFTTDNTPTRDGPDSRDRTLAVKKRKNT